MKQLPINLKTILNIMGIILMTIVAQAQQDKSKRPSPPDRTSADVDGLSVTIDYSQPGVKGRKIWDGLVPYGKVWRTGANEASWIEVSEDVQIAGKTLPAGKYGLFTIPGEEEWTIIFNKTWDQWGAYEYDSEKDVLRVTAPSGKSDKFYERFTIQVDNTGTVTMNWENLAVKFEISK
ncbi:DUF2911 domain-containing protein [Marinoscillum sp.]|uniref:DUF2911 domain-containing protein n=1 Tax=Marinoscillum sp. TaxID=2024838 RepID=UPI003BAB871E